MNQAKEIKTPTLVLAASEDCPTPMKYSRHLSEQIDGAGMKIIEKAGHMMMLEKPADVNRCLDQFINTLI